MNRRDFLLTTSALALATTLRASETAPKFKTTPKAAFLGGLPDEAQMTQLLDHGFTGMEIMGSYTLEQATAAKKVADRLGFTFHSLMGCSAPERVELAAALGADAALVVPASVGGMPMPQPWEFELEYDPKTAVLKRVVAGDNAPYQAYIDAHNAAADGARRMYDTILPAAEKNGVVLGQENVWNNMWVKPDFAACYVFSFGTPWLQGYVDLGNHVRYANTLDWFKAYGDKIVRIHLKDFRMNPNGQDGSWCRLGEGSVDWVRVRQEMERVGYSSWCTVEPEGGVQMALEYQREAARRILVGLGGMA